MDLTASQVERVRNELRRLKTEQFKGNESALARALGIGQSTVTRCIRGTLGSSMATAEQVARVAGISLSSLLGLDAGPESPPRLGELALWAAAEQALRASRYGRRFSERAWELARDSRWPTKPAHLDETLMVRLLELAQSMADDEAPPPKSAPRPVSQPAVPTAASR